MTTVDEARAALCALCDLPIDDSDHGYGGSHNWMPVGAIVASALMAANYPGDSGEDVDRFLVELRQRGYIVVRLAEAER